MLCKPPRQICVSRGKRCHFYDEKNDKSLESGKFFEIFGLYTDCTLTVVSFKVFTVKQKTRDMCYVSLSGLLAVFFM